MVARNRPVAKRERAAPAAPRACWPAPSAAPEFVEVELEPAPPHARPSGAVAVDLRTMPALVGPGADEGVFHNN